jgi:hypothetical protein
MTATVRASEHCSSSRVSHLIAILRGPLSAHQYDITYCIPNKNEQYR